MDRIQLRRDSSARWAEINPVLLEGEVGYETDTKLRKIGDGYHAWNYLDYLAAENIVQELGDSENVVISQKGVTEKLTELESILLSGFLEVKEEEGNVRRSHTNIESNSTYVLTLSDTEWGKLLSDNTVLFGVFVKYVEDSSETPLYRIHKPQKVETQYYIITENKPVEYIRVAINGNLGDKVGYTLQNLSFALPAIKELGKINNNEWQRGRSSTSNGLMVVDESEKTRLLNTAFLPVQKGDMIVSEYPLNYLFYTSASVDDYVSEKSDISWQKGIKFIKDDGYVRIFLRVSESNQEITEEIKEDIIRTTSVSDIRLTELESLFGRVQLAEQQVEHNSNVLSKIESDFYEKYELLSHENQLRSDSPLVYDESGKSIGVGDWVLRYPTGNNSVEKIDDFFRISLNSASGTNPGFWLLDKMNDYINKAVKVSFEFRIRQTNKPTYFLIGSADNQQLLDFYSETEWQTFDKTIVIGDSYPDNRAFFYSNGVTIFDVRNINIVFSESLTEKVEDLQKKVEYNYIPSNINTEYLPNILSKIGQNIFEQKGVMNIGMFGDSWTHGVTANGVNGLITYVKYVARILWQKYGYAGHGWFDFGRSNNTDMMCADDEAFTLNKSGNFNFVSKTSDAKGITISHTEFGLGASYTLQLVDTKHPIDKAVVWFYNDAKFKLSINDNKSVLIEADSVSGWQSYEVVGNITKIKVESTIEGSIIFGVDLSYGDKGVKVHKLGNRGLNTPVAVSVDAEIWKQGIAKLNLDFFSVMLYTNDRSGNYEPSVVTSYIAELLNRFEEATPMRDKVIFAPSDTKGGKGTYSVQDYAKSLATYCINHNIPFISLIPIFGTQEQINALGTFVDALHPSKTGDYMIAEYIFKHLFEYYQYM